MFLKVYNYFVRGLVLFLLICIPYSLVTNPELIEDEVDFYFFVIAYVLILLFYVVWNYIYNYLRRKRGQFCYYEWARKNRCMQFFLFFLPNGRFNFAESE